MPEERKPAPLPPLPWKANPDPWYSRTQVQDAEGCIIVEIGGTDEGAVAIADLFCRAPALEAERDDAYMQATANNEVATSLHEQLKDARALLRELVKAATTASMALSRLLRDEILADVAHDPDSQLSPGALKAKRNWEYGSNALKELRDVLLRVDAEAGEETR